MAEQNEQATTQTEQTTETKTRKPRGKSPSAEQFGQIWNESSSRQDALKRFANAGFDVSYSAMVAREKSYREKGVHLKDMPAAPKGRRLDVSAVNATLDAQKAAGEGEQSPVKNAE